MNNIEKNALRIVELFRYNKTNEYMCKFTDYNHLMLLMFKLLFESIMKETDSQITEPVFIESIQLEVIRLLKEKYEKQT